MSENTRIAIVSVVIEKLESAKEVNLILHQYADYIIGRMGIPYKQKGVYLISIAVDAPTEKIAALTGKLGKADGTSVKTAYSKTGI